LQKTKIRASVVSLAEEANAKPKKTISELIPTRNADMFTLKQMRIRSEDRRA